MTPTPSSRLKSWLYAAGVAAGGLVGALPAMAQTYPDKPIRVVIATAAGGAMDVTTRMVTDKLATKLGQPIIVENRGGAGGAIAAASVAKSAPDGYTVLVVSAGYSTLPILQPNLGFAPTDLVPVVPTVSLPYLIVTPANQPYKTLGDFIADAKKRPGQLTFPSGGNGTSGHLIASWLKLEAGIDVLHVPYKGEGPALQGLLGDQLQMMPVTISAGLPLVKSGKLRALAITGAKRSSLLPDVPTIEEQGVPVHSSTWFGMLAPAGVPKAVLAKLNEAVNDCLQDPALRAAFIDQGIEIEGGTQDNFRQLILKEGATWARVIKAANIKAE